MVRSFALFATLELTVLCSPARAAEIGSGVVVHAAGCEPRLVASIRRIIRVELSAAETMPHALVRIDCSLEQIDIRLEGRSDTKTLPASQLPSRLGPRTRLLALVVVEMLGRTSHPKEWETILPSVEEEEIAVLTGAAPHTTTSELGLDVTGVGSVRAMDASGPSWGGGLALSYHLVERFSLSLLAEALRATRRLEPGSVSRTELSGMIGLQMRVVGDRDLGLSVIAGPRLAAVRFAGAAADADYEQRTFWDSSGGLAAAVAFEGAIFGSLRALARIETGYAIRGVEARAGERTVLAVRGLWLQANLGLGWAF